MHAPCPADCDGWRAPTPPLRGTPIAIWCDMPTATTLLRALTLAACALLVVSTTGRAQSEAAKPAQAAACEGACRAREPTSNTHPHTVPSGPHARKPQRDDAAGPLRLQAGLVEGEQASRPRWYGWQLLIADVLSIGLVLNEPTFYYGMAGLVFVSPGLHFIQGEGGTGALSLGLRVTFGALLTLAQIGSELADASLHEYVFDNSEMDGDDYVASNIPIELAAAASIGLLVIAAADAALLAYSPPPAAERAARSSTRVTPWADVGSGGAGICVSWQM